MKRTLLSLLVLVLAASLLPASASLAQGPESPTAPLDDELVLLTNVGRIVVDDPHVPPGVQPVVWESPDTGWTNIATGDFNGDGDAEIIALSGSRAKVFDPVVPSGTPPVTFDKFVSGETWRLVATGNIDSDNRDEIILTRRAGNSDVETLVAYDGNAAGTSWTLVHSAEFRLWKEITCGDVDGDNMDEVAAIREPGDDNKIVIWDPQSGWSTLHNQAYSYPWLDMQIADAVQDSSNKEEILVTREGVVTSLPSFYVFRWKSGQSNLKTERSEKFFPYFFDIAPGDSTLDGIAEVYLLRKTEGSSNALIVRSYGPVQPNRFETLLGQNRWNATIAADLDGDSRAEVTVVSSNEFRIFWHPEQNEEYEPHPGNYLNSHRVAAGDIDGPGVPVGPALQLSGTSFTFDLQGGQTASQQVQVTNGGDGSVIWWTASIIEGTPWLTISPGNGTTPGVLSLHVNTAGLLAGAHHGVVRVSGGAGVANSPQDISVTVNVTAPSLSVSPNFLTWQHVQGSPAVTKFVNVFGPDVPWHAGTVPMSSVPAIQEGLDAGVPLVFEQDRIVIGHGESPEDVPIVDWVSITPSVGTATQWGTSVAIDLVTSRVPLGFSWVAVVFVADIQSSPRAVVVDVEVTSTPSESGEKLYMPFIGLSQ
ncbi:MAG: hypothetical protein U9R25_01205 [Chloroflexota bacterium]|nr:hypothetical protein [Chloroflexota bacterium]